MALSQWCPWATETPGQAEHGKGHKKEKHPFRVAIQPRVVRQGSFLEDVTPEPSLGNACSW